jgi:6-phosphogluconolactonase
MPADAHVVAVDPSGSFLDVAGQGVPGPGGTPTGSVSVFMIDTATGALSPLVDSDYATGNGPLAVTLDPSGKFLYVGYFTNNAVFYTQAFTRDATTGALTTVPGSPFLTDGGGIFAFTVSPSITVNPNGKFLYVTGPGFALNASGTFAYSQYNVLAYAIDPSSGALTALAGSPLFRQ